MAKSKKKKAPESKKEVQVQQISSREQLMQRMNRGQVKDQFKLSDIDWAKHMAVTSVWNTMSREKAVTQLELENMQYAEAAELQQQQTKFTDTKPYRAYITSITPDHCMQEILNIHLN